MASVDNAGTPGVPDVVLAGQFDGQGDRTSLSATIAGVKDYLNSYSYDTLSRLASIEQQGQTGGNAVAPKTIDFGYDGIGDITQIYRMDSVGMGPNPQSDPADTAIGYNSLGQLTGMTPSHNGVNIDPLSWTFDTLDREATFTNSDGTATYGYNPDNELTSVSYTGATEPPNESYSFDPNGNQNEAGHVVSPANQVTNDGTFTYAFDNEGNRTSRTRISSDYATDHTVTYFWDYRDRLTDVEYFDNNSVLTKHVHYVYDVFDHLIETEVDPTGGGAYTVVTHNIYDLSKPVVTAEDATQPVEPGLMISAAGNVVLQTNGSQQLTERILNGPITSAADAFFTTLAQDYVPSGKTYWFLLNNQGSFMDAVDADGNRVDHATYTAFGQLYHETNPSIPHLTGFAGGLLGASTGDVSFLHRWYAPSAAVWLSVDAIGFRARDLNETRYIGNEPVNTVDPTGLIGHGPDGEPGFGPPDSSWPPPEPNPPAAQTPPGNVIVSPGFWGWFWGYPPEYKPAPYSGEGTTVVMVSNYTVPGDEDSYPDADEVHTGLCDAKDMLRVLKNSHEHGEIGQLIVSGHGAFGGGAACLQGGTIGPNMGKKLAEAIGAFLAEDGVVIFAVCGSGQWEAELQQLADWLGHDIIVTPGQSHNGDESNRPWITIHPHPAPE